MAYKPLENLKGHVTSRPPVVIFIGCMFLFAISVIILGYYFRHNDVRNYDISEVRTRCVGPVARPWVPGLKAIGQSTISDVHVFGYRIPSIVIACQV